jgi:hypothetical protein
MAPLQKSNKAPKARNMKARGKRKAKRSASPLGYIIKIRAALKGRNTCDISALQALLLALRATRGDVLRFASHLPLAFILPRLRRSI